MASPATTARATTRPSPCFSPNFRFVSFIVPNFDGESRLGAGTFNLDLQPRFCIVQPLHGQAADPALDEHFANLLFYRGPVRSRLIVFRKLRHQLLPVIRVNVRGFDLHGRPEFVIDVALDINLPAQQLPHLIGGKAKIVQTRCVLLRASQTVP